MKTKDFIKMLQDADPEGEGYIRMDGGIPYHAEAKEGYWDGPYSYIDEDGNYVYSIEGYKVDIYCNEIDDFVSNLVNIHEPNNWEKIKSKFKFKLGGYCVEGQRNERAERVLKQAKEAFDMITEFKKDSLNKSTIQAVERYNLGWRFFQDKRVDDKLKPNLYYYSHWKIVEPNLKIQSSCMHDVNGVLHSGLFERIENKKEEDYYEWILKE